MPKSLRTRLTLVFVVVAVVPLLFLAGLIAWQSFDAMQDQAINMQQAITQHLAAEIGAFLSERQNELKLLVEIRGLGKLDQAAQRELMSSLLANQPAYQELILLDQNGQEQIRLSRSMVVAARDLANRAESEAFSSPANSGKIYYSPVRFDETIREPLMTIAMPIMDLRSGKATHILMAELRFKTIWDLVAGFRGGHEYAYVVDGQNVVVAHRDPSIVLGKTTFNLPIRNGSGRYSGLSGSDVILAATRVGFSNQELIAVAEQPYSEAAGLAIRLVTLVGIITAVALATAVVAGLVMIGQIVKPVEKLSAGVRAVQAGDLSQTVEISSGDEIGQLAQTFNSMTAQLRDTIANLEQSQARFRNIIESVPIGMYLYHLEPGNRLIFDGANPAAGEMLDLVSNDMISQPIETAFPGLAQTELPQQYRKVAAEGTTWQTELVYAPTTNGTGANQSIYQVYAFQTSPDNIVAAFLDVTENKLAEEEREKLQQEIIDAQRRAIQELSTPVIPLMDEIIVMPLIGSIDTLRARDITRMLLAGISQRRAKVVILDVTGVPLVDSGVAEHLNKTIQAARLKGARTIVTGISDAVAETIVELGIDWGNIETLTDLQTGLVAALNSLGIQLTTEEKTIKILS